MKEVIDWASGSGGSATFADVAPADIGVVKAAAKAPAQQPDPAAMTQAEVAEAQRIADAAVADFLAAGGDAATNGGRVCAKSVSDALLAAGVAGASDMAASLPRAIASLFGRNQGGTAGGGGGATGGATGGGAGGTTGGTTGGGA